MKLTDYVWRFDKAHQLRRNRWSVRRGFLRDLIQSVVW